jgi:hypothetical protein
MHTGSPPATKVPLGDFAINAANAPSFLLGKTDLCLAFAPVLADRLHGLTMIARNSGEAGSGRGSLAQPCGSRHRNPTLTAAVFEPQTIEARGYAICNDRRY